MLDSSKTRSNIYKGEVPYYVLFSYFVTYMTYENIQDRFNEYVMFTRTYSNMVRNPCQSRDGLDFSVYMPGD